MHLTQDISRPHPEKPLVPVSLLTRGDAAGQTEAEVKPGPTPVLFTTFPPHAPHKAVLLLKSTTMGGARGVSQAPCSVLGTRWCVKYRAGTGLGKQSPKEAEFKAALALGGRHDAKREALCCFCFCALGTWFALPGKTDPVPVSGEHTASAGGVALEEGA